MTDEANARSFSIVMELIEGHEFLQNQLDFRPQSHWSIDPFGLSSTLAKLIKESNFTHMTVQRVHYSIKKYLAETKQLEFRWRQLFAGDNSNTDIRTHMFPFYSYDVPHTCGPDPSIWLVLCFELIFEQFLILVVSLIFAVSVQLAVRGENVLNVLPIKMSRHELKCLLINIVKKLNYIE